MIPPTSPSVSHLMMRLGRYRQPCQGRANPAIHAHNRAKKVRGDAAIFPARITTFTLLVITKSAQEPFLVCIYNSKCVSYPGDMKQLLENKVALVAGATRGAGRGIAVELGAMGATVYCTGRSVRGNTTGRTETIDETAELVTKAGGKGVAVQVDHTIPEEVQALVKRIDKEQNGQLDFIVNDIWGGDELAEWDVPFWEHNLETLQYLFRVKGTVC